MTRKYFIPLLVLFLLTSFAAAVFAIVKGLESDKQSIVKIGESVTVPEGAQVKSAVAVGGSVTVYGEVEKDVVAVGGSVFLKDSAMVGGDVVSIGGKIMKEAGAISKGDIIEVAIAGVAPAISFFTRGGILQGMAVFWVFTAVGFIILTVILVSVFTPQLGRISAALEKDLWWSFLVGLLIMVLFIPAIIVLVVSIIGIILIPVWLVIVAAAGLFGYIAAGHFLGKKALNAFKIKGKSMMIETLTGVMLLSIVGLLPIGGFFIKAIASLCGLGGVYETRFGTK